MKDPPKKRIFRCILQHYFFWITEARSDLRSRQILRDQYSPISELNKQNKQVPQHFLLHLALQSIFQQL